MEGKVECNEVREESSVTPPSTSIPDDEYIPWAELVTESSNRILDIYNDESLEGYVKLKKASDCIDWFYSRCSRGEVRMAVIELMCTAHRLLADAKDIKPEDIAQRICLRSETFMKQKYREEEAIDKIMAAEIDDKLWDSGFSIAINFRCPKYAVVLDKLFHIKKPESDGRFKKIRDNVTRLLDDEITFPVGVSWVCAFNLQDIKNNQFESLIYKCYLTNASTLDFILTDKESKERYLHVLDDLLARWKARKHMSALEKCFIKAVDAHKLPALIGKQARKFNVDIDKPGFTAHRMRVINDLRYKFTKSDDLSVFEDIALQVIPNRGSDYKLDFLDIFGNRKNHQYAFGWAKFLKIPYNNLPYWLKNVPAGYHSTADAFVQRLSTRAASPIPEDSLQKCELFGKVYDIIVVSTPKALEYFIQAYFIEKKPAILGLDCEAGSFATGTSNKVTVFQLASPEWLCLVDIYLLSKKVTEEQWSLFFEKIFDPDITRVGFAFGSDYSYLLGAFPHIASIIQDEKRKVLCIAKLLNAILINFEAEKAVFPEKPPTSISLADVTEAVVGGTMDKTMQASNWTQRPLSDEQKIYAVTDALACVLIKEKIEGDLISKLGEGKTKEIMNEGLINHVIKVKNENKNGTAAETSVEKDKKSVQFSDVIAAAKEIGEALKADGEGYSNQLEVYLVLDAPFFNLFGYLHNLGISAYDVRLKGIQNNKQQVAALQSEFKNHPDAILVTTEKRRKDFKNVPSSQVLIMPTAGDFVPLHYITRILRSLRIVIDEKYLFSRCEKCSSPDLRPIPSPLYVLVYYIYLVVKKIGFRFSVNMADVRKSAQEVLSMNREDYGEIDVKVIFQETPKPEVIFDAGDYIIKPLSCQLLRKGDNSATFSIKPPSGAFFASRPGVSHIVCLDCGHIYHREDSKEVVEAIAAGKANYKLTEVSDTDETEVKQQIGKTLKEVFQSPPLEGS